MLILVDVYCFLLQYASIRKKYLKNKITFVSIIYNITFGIQTLITKFFLFTKIIVKQRFYKIVFEI